MNVTKLSQDETGAVTMNNDHDFFIGLLSIIFCVVMICMCLVGIVFNSLSLSIYASKGFRRRAINVLLAALSAADLGVCILAIPAFSFTQFQEMLPEYISTVTSGYIIFMVYPITLMLQSMSVWLLVYITVDRYLAVCHPFTARVHSSRKRSITVVAMIVIFSILYNLVRFWEFRPHPEKFVEPVLRANPDFMLWYQNMATMFTQFLVPLVVLGVLNLEVARTILKAHEMRRELVASEKREHNTAKMMLFVVIVFLFCYTFSFILNVAEVLDEAIFRQPIGFLLNDVNNILIVLNSSSSFIFYCIYSSRFRLHLKRTCCIRWWSIRCGCRDLTDGECPAGLNSQFSYYRRRQSNLLNNNGNHNNKSSTICTENTTMVTTS